MQAPKIPEKPVGAHLGPDPITPRFLQGRGFKDRRDAAFICIFIDTGGCLPEVEDLRYSVSEPLGNDIDLE